MNDLISRQAAINAMCEVCSDWCDEGVCRKVSAIQELPPAQRWIPCSERLPEDKKAVYWACNDNGHQFECRWTNANHFWTEFTTDWHWNLFDVPQYSKVVAWMPLPEPYRGGYTWAK